MKYYQAELKTQTQALFHRNTQKHTDTQANTKLSNQEPHTQRSEINRSPIRPRSDL